MTRNPGPPVEVLATRIDYLERSSEQTAERTAEAIKVAREAIERRFESVNEFRAALSDQAHTFIPRHEVEVLIGNLNMQLESVSSRLTALVAGQTAKQAGLASGWGYAIGALGIILSVLSIVGFLITKLNLAHA